MSTDGVADEIPPDGPDRDVDDGAPAANLFGFNINGDRVPTAVELVNSLAAAGAAFEPLPVDVINPTEHALGGDPLGDVGEGVEVVRSADDPDRLVIRTTDGLQGIVGAVGRQGPDVAISISTFEERLRAALRNLPQAESPHSVSMSAIGAAPVSSSKLFLRTTVSLIEVTDMVRFLIREPNRHHAPRDTPPYQLLLVPLYSEVANYATSVDPLTSAIAPVSAVYFYSLAAAQQALDLIQTGMAAMLSNSARHMRVIDIRDLMQQPAPAVDASTERELRSIDLGDSYAGQQQHELRQYAEPGGDSQAPMQEEIREEMDQRPSGSGDYAAALRSSLLRTAEQLAARSGPESMQPSRQFNPGPSRMQSMMLGGGHTSDTRATTGEVAARDESPASDDSADGRLALQILSAAGLSRDEIRRIRAGAESNLARREVGPAGAATTATGTALRALESEFRSRRRDTGRDA